MNKLPNHKLELKDFEEAINLLKSNGFNPIGVTQIYMEHTFIFETDEEATKAYELLEVEKREVVGWFYGKEKFLETKKQYESEYIGYFVKVFWLTETK